MVLPASGVIRTEFEGLLAFMSDIRSTGPRGRSWTAMLGDDCGDGSRSRGSKTSVPGLKYWTHPKGEGGKIWGIERARRGHLGLGTDPSLGAGTTIRLQRHLMISSADTRSEAGIERPSVLAVLRLTTSSSFSGVRTGISAGLAPLRILPA
jgi:hypothetical protein